MAFEDQGEKRILRWEFRRWQDAVVEILRFAQDDTFFVALLLTRARGI